MYRLNCCGIKGLGLIICKHSPNPFVVPRFIAAALLEAGKDRMNAVTTNGP